MRITEFQVTHYGPLRSTEKITLKDFDLFYGKNEHGKTLLIDSLVKILLSGNSQSFKGIDRVDENPEGYGYVKDKNGSIWKLPEKGNLTTLSELTAAELRNIFIIRNSDLAIPEGEEFAFYRNITERLTGLRTPTIRAVKERLQELGNLTQPNSYGSLTNSASSGKLKSRIRKAESLIDEIKQLNEKAETENLDELEEQISEITEAEAVAVQELDALEAAQKREKFEEATRALENLTRTERELELLEVFNDDDLHAWREGVSDLKRHQNEHKNLVLKIAETKKEFEEKKVILDEKSRGLDILNERKRTLDEDIKPRLKDYEVKSKELSALQSNEKFAMVSFSVFISLVAVSLIGLIVSQLPLFTFFSILFSVLSLLFAALKLRSLRKRGQVASLWQGIRLETSKFEIEADDVERILARIQTFDEVYSKSQKTVRQLQTDVAVREQKLSSLTDEELPTNEREAKETEDKINDLKIKSKVDNVQDYTKNLKAKLAQENLRDGTVAVLKSHFGEKSKKASLEDNIEYWKEKATELESYREKSKETKYSEKRVTELKEKAQEIGQQKKEIQQKLTEFQDALATIGREVNVSVKPLENPVICETLTDIRKISQILQEFVDSVNGNTSDVIEIMKIFEAMEGEEEQKVEQLFGGKSSPVSDYFKEITDGLYQKVEYLSNEQTIRAVMKSGEVLDAEKLSGGAYDQLYLSVRLALGEKLLKGERGFFIMDDPFVKADIDRLAKQLNVLKRISKEGWQILYFTAKDEVKDALEEDLANRSIGYHEIENTSS